MKARRADIRLAQWSGLSQAAALGNRRTRGERPVRLTQGRSDEIDSMRGRRPQSVTTYSMSIFYHQMLYIINIYAKKIIVPGCKPYAPERFPSKA
jgi:hypothetical protein